MTRRLRQLAHADFEHLPSGCGGCTFWESDDQRLERRCGASCDAELRSEWFHRVMAEWGDCGKVAYEDDDVLGFIKFAPSGYFPQAQTFNSAPDDPDVPMIACMHISPDARHHGLGTIMLRACLRELVTRGERKVEVFAAAQRPANIEESPMMSIEFLLRNGFRVSKPDPQYPLLQLELRSLAVITENLEAVLQSLKLPVRMPGRAPAPW